MALIIPTLKLGNKTTENAYAKVGRVTVDNNTKKASFNVVVYKSKEDKTVLLQVPTQSISVVADVDIIHQCYDGIKAKVVEVEAQIAEMQEEQDLAGKAATPQLKWKLATTKASPLLHFKGTVDDI